MFTMSQHYPGFIIGQFFTGPGGYHGPLMWGYLLLKFPKLKVWIMHAGSPFLEDTIGIMSVYQNVYTDISVISNPYIVS